MVKTAHSSKPAEVLDARQALQVYLEQLLLEIIPDDPDVTEGDTDTHAASAEASSVPSSDAGEQPRHADQVAGSTPGPPAWGAAPFQSLLIKVAGLSLAIPLAKLNGVIEYTTEITPMPGHSPWFLGLHKARGVQTKVIDTALLIVPQKHRPPDHAARLRKIVLLDEGRWGLACEEVSEVITLTPESVRWRGPSSRRPWLAGTALEHMCALLDTDAFVELLASDQVGPAA